MGFFAIEIVWTALQLSREFREGFRELLRLARSGISEFLAGAQEFRRGTPL
jgi:uncharacterized membrane protein